MEIFDDILKIKGLELHDWEAIFEIKKKYTGEKKMPMREKYIRMSMCATLKYTRKLIETGYAKQPTADVVEVVRCKDCAVPHNQWTGCPKLNGLVTPPDFYCGYGEGR